MVCYVRLWLHGDRSAPWSSGTDTGNESLLGLPNYGLARPHPHRRHPHRHHSTPQPCTKASSSFIFWGKGKNNTLLAWSLDLFARHDKVLQSAKGNIFNVHPLDLVFGSNSINNNKALMQSEQQGFATALPRPLFVQIESIKEKWSPDWTLAQLCPLSVESRSRNILISNVLFCCGVVKNLKNAKCKNSQHSK